MRPKRHSPTPRGTAGVPGTRKRFLATRHPWHGPPGPKKPVRSDGREPWRNGWKPSSPGLRSSEVTRSPRHGRRGGGLRGTDQNPSPTAPDPDPATAGQRTWAMPPNRTLAFEQKAGELRNRLAPLRGEPASLAAERASRGRIHDARSVLSRAFDRARRRRSPGQHMPTNTAGSPNTQSPQMGPRHIGTFTYDPHDE